MNRLQKKCVLASTGVHVLLVVIMFIGPAFLSRQKPAEDFTPLDFTPVITTDEKVSGGGNPKGASPAPAPATPVQPQARVAEPPKPDPAPVQPPEPVKEVKNSSDPDSYDISEKKHKVEVSTKLVRRKTDNKAALKKKAEEQAAAEARQWADARRRAAAIIGNAADRVQSDIAEGTSLELKGPGGGGVPYANFNQAVLSVYWRAFHGSVPSDATDDEARAEASITIARDGRVIRHTLIRASGKGAFDRAVESVLDRVEYAAPLPQGSKEEQRTVIITFSADAKRGIG